MDITIISDALYTDKASTTKSLACALRQRNNNINMILPYYEKAYKSAEFKFNITKSFCVHLPCGNFTVSVFKTHLDGIGYTFIHSNNLFSREKAWGYPDDAMRSAVFCTAALEVLDKTDYIITDSENTAIVPVYLKFKYNHNPNYSNIKSYHYINSGNFINYDKTNLINTFGIPKEDSAILTDNSYLNLTKAAIVTASRIFIGENAAEMLYNHTDDIHHTAVQFGFKIRKIRMGLDYNIFSPEHDDDIHKTYSRNELDNKYDNKLYVQKHLYLEENKEIPLVVLYPDKNKSIITRVLHDMMRCDMQIIILSDKYCNLSIPANTKRIVTIGDCSYPVLKNIFSASDLAVFGGFGSKCGNPSYISAAYGCVPIVPSHRFFDFGFSYYNKLTSDGNGYTYDPNIPQDLMYTLWDALGLFKHDKRNFNKLIQNTMKKVFSVYDTAETIEIETEKTLYSFI